MPESWAARSATHWRTETEISPGVMRGGGRLEPTPPLIESTATQTTDDQWRVLERVGGVGELAQAAVVARGRHSQAIADPRGLGFGPGPPRFLEVEDLTVLVCQSHREVKPANAPRAKQGSSPVCPFVPGPAQDRR